MEGAAAIGERVSALALIAGLLALPSATLQAADPAASSTPGIGIEIMVPTASTTDPALPVTTPLGLATSTTVTATTTESVATSTLPAPRPRTLGPARPIMVRAIAPDEAPVFQKRGAGPISVASSQAFQKEVIMPPAPPAPVREAVVPLPPEVAETPAATSTEPMPDIAKPQEFTLPASTSPLIASTTSPIATSTATTTPDVGPINHPNTPPSVMSDPPAVVSKPDEAAAPETHPDRERAD